MFMPFEPLSDLASLYQQMGTASQLLATVPIAGALNEEQKLALEETYRTLSASKLLGATEAQIYLETLKGSFLKKLFPSLPFFGAARWHGGPEDWHTSPRMHYENALHFIEKVQPEAHPATKSNSYLRDYLREHYYWLLKELAQLAAADVRRNAAAGTSGYSGQSLDCAVRYLTKLLAGEHSELFSYCRGWFGDDLGIPTTHILTELADLNFVSGRYVEAVSWYNTCQSRVGALTAEQAGNYRLCLTTLTDKIKEKTPEIIDPKDEPLLNRLSSLSHLGATISHLEYDGAIRENRIVIASFGFRKHQLDALLNHLLDHKLQFGDLSLDELKAFSEL
jgi:hypothetical protein